MSQYVFVMTITKNRLFPSGLPWMISIAPDHTISASHHHWSRQVSHSPSTPSALGPIMVRQAAIDYAGHIPDEPEKPGFAPLCLILLVALAGNALANFKLKAKTQLSGLEVRILHLGTMHEKNAITAATHPKK